MTHIFARLIVPLATILLFFGQLTSKLEPSRKLFDWFESRVHRDSREGEAVAVNDANFVAFSRALISMTNFPIGNYVFTNLSTESRTNVEFFQTSSMSGVVVSNRVVEEIRKDLARLLSGRILKDEELFRPHGVPASLSKLAYLTGLGTKNWQRLRFNRAVLGTVLPDYIRSGGVVDTLADQSIGRLGPLLDGGFVILLVSWLFHRFVSEWWKYYPGLERSNLSGYWLAITRYDTPHDAKQIVLVGARIRQTIFKASLSDGEFFNGPARASKRWQSTSFRVDDDDHLDASMSYNIVDVSGPAETGQALESISEGAHSDHELYKYAGLSWPKRVLAYFKFKVWAPARRIRVLRGKFYSAYVTPSSQPYSGITDYFLVTPAEFREWRRWLHCEGRDGDVPAPPKVLADHPALREEWLGVVDFLKTNAAFGKKVEVDAAGGRKVV